jgi:hypothetical protein
MRLRRQKQQQQQQQQQQLSTPTMSMPCEDCVAACLQRKITLLVRVAVVVAMSMVAVVAAADQNVAMMTIKG